jgi:hypothetical protein
MDSVIYIYIYLYIFSEDTENTSVYNCFFLPPFRCFFFVNEKVQALYNIKYRILTIGFQIQTVMSTNDGKLKAFINHTEEHSVSPEWIISLYPS